MAAAGKDVSQPSQRRRRRPSSVCTHRLMAVVHPADELLEEVSRLVLAEAACLDDAVKQLAASCVLHDYAQVRGRQVQLQAGTAHSGTHWSGTHPQVWRRHTCSLAVQPQQDQLHAPTRGGHLPYRQLQNTTHTSLKLTTFALSSMRWLRISRSTFLSTCSSTRPCME